ncbi:type VII secretion protein EccCb [Tsukamurella tyrosinosolvens]|uniref:type VII secretion protein EccCb n=1 Tax=Tsukamurella tyrosinosolvens TaxID=57704 RepID=UPI002163252C|nr:type VII secretion protein EccCb [Tsukamurella tyrosinosolvens]
MPERLPNTGSVATRYDGDLARRIVADLHGSLDSREQFFASRRIQGIADLRARIASGEQFPEIVTADVVLAIDGWASFKENHEDLVDVVQDIGNRGLALGIHVVIVGGRWADLRMSMQAVIGTKIEHRLNDPLDSTIGRAQNTLIRADQPGRVITTEPLGAQAQIALPHLSSDSGFDEVVEVARHRAAGQAMPPVPTLPDALAYRGFRSGFPEREPLLVGINETDLAPLVLDPTTTDQHLLVIGESRSGKTNLLRVIVEELVSTHTDEQLVIGLFDPRRTLQGFVPDDYLGGYAGSPPAAGALAAGIAEELQRRLPPEDLQQQTAPFTGPHIYLIVDDYDLLASGTSNNPLAPLIPYLPYAADIGLHLVVARRSAGISRALYDSVVGGIREHNATMVLFSGDRQEGSLAPGVHLTHQPVGRVRIIRPHSAPVHAQTLLLESD